MFNVGNVYVLECSICNSGQIFCTFEMHAVKNILQFIFPQNRAIIINFNSQTTALQCR
jgi:hypothetical protein